MELNLRFSPNDPPIVKKTEFVVPAGAEAPPDVQPGKGPVEVKPADVTPAEAAAHGAPEAGRAGEKGN